MGVIYLSENNNNNNPPTENSPASGEEKSIAETAKINEYLQNVPLSKTTSQNLIAFIASTIRILLNKPKTIKFDMNETAHKMRLEYSEETYDAEYVINAIKNFELLFRSLDARKFPADKWYLLNINESNIAIIVRGKTRQEADVIYNAFKKVIKESQKIAWQGRYKLYRLFEFN